VRCVKHDYIFTTKYENVRRASRAHHICPYCKEEDIKARYQDSRTEVECAYCGIKFFKKNSKLENSKSGLYFCCREHKDLAQRVDSGEKFNELRPAHYGTGLSHYRERAFAEYEHKCAVCG
jgi:Zn ribbon nucleic-acid-binding protein